MSCPAAEVRRLLPRTSNPPRYVNQRGRTEHRHSDPYRMEHQSERQIDNGSDHDRNDIILASPVWDRRGARIAAMLKRNAIVDRPGEYRPKQNDRAKVAIRDQVRKRPQFDADQHRVLEGAGDVASNISGGDANERRPNQDRGHHARPGGRVPDVDPAGRAVSPEPHHDQNEPGGSDERIERLIGPGPQALDQLGASFPQRRQHVDAEKNYKPEYENSETHLGLSLGTDGVEAMSAAMARLQPDRSSRVDGTAAGGQTDAPKPERTGMKRIIAALTLGLLLVAPALAQDWPTRSVKLIVPFAAGATPDIVARLLADELQAKLGQPFVVENKPGASGNLGTDAVAKAEPDGYTLGISIGGPLAINMLLFSKLPYDPAKDLAFITMLATQPSALAVNTAIKVDSVGELVALLKRNPGKYNFGSIGNGSLSHLAMEAIALKSGTQMVHVPYPSSPQAVTALMRGDVQMACLP